MKKAIDFYFDFSSSYSYIGQHRVRALAREFDVSVDSKPIALGAIFKARGHAPPRPDSLKGRYVWHDVERSAAEWSLPYHWPNPFPFNSILAARAYWFLKEIDEEDAEAWIGAVFDASFGQGRDASDPAVLAEVAAGLDLDADEVMQGTSRDEVKQKLKDVTDEAMGRGVFGAPAFFLDGEMYWGADRIDQMWRTLERERQGVQ
ncbi:MAG: 2-hydroxychromene-2-carboxylate isomerase [Gammaproteobacteria bacterium]|jgi:2-hydroxychromene-2-carboxylate isomerase|nr:2-hydroxychromene-2-carboxylate isomerase [Gammaproteobacteria bacterium]